MSSSNSTTFARTKRDKLDRPAEPSLFRRELPYRLAAAVMGALLGLSAPGFEQWYLVWFGLTPVLYLAVTAKEPWLAGVRGWYFFTAYNLVYMSWYLYFRPIFGQGNFVVLPFLLPVSFWLVMSAWQGLFVSIFTCVLKAIPLTGGWLPRQHQGRWLLPGCVILPLLWILLDRMCNATELLGVPWSSLEYSQYKQVPIIQAASIIGGAGIGACIVMANVTILGLLSHKRPELKDFGFGSKASMILNTVVSLSLLLALPAFGIWRIAQQDGTPRKMQMVSAVQSNQSTKLHGVSADKIATTYLDLCKKSPAGGICIWPEWAFPFDFTCHAGLFKTAATVPKKWKQSWVLGVVDTDAQGREYNSVCAMDRTGKLLPEIYHKRYLVPFGEFTPGWARETPIGVILYGFNKYYNDTTPDTKTVLFKLSNGCVGSMLCFECILPGLSVESVRAGAEILVDCSNTCWFYSSNLSDQMHAFCTLRAVENHRSFVFSTVLGPSLIVDSIGRHLRQAPREQAASISAEVPVETDLTPFTRFFF